MARDGPSWDSIDRRRFLKTTGAGAVAVSVAGCQGDGGDTETDGDGDGGTPEDDATETPTETATTIAAGEEVPRGGIMTIGSSQPKGVNPLAVSSSYSWALMDYVYTYGTALDPFEFQVHPSAYTDWTVENVESGKPDVYFDVRDGMTFNDGEDMTVEDVVWTYNYLMEQKPGRYLSTVKPIETVEKASGNDWDVHMKLTKPVGTYEVNQLSLPLLPKHIWSDIDDYQKYQPGQQIGDGRPVGGGPGRITKYDQDTSAEIEFRDDYNLNDLEWIEEHDKLRAGGPFLDGLRFKFYTSENSKIQAVLEGNLDATFEGVPSGQIEKARNKDFLELVPGTDSGYGYFGYNLRRKPFDDLPFRQALSFLWDDVYYIRRLNKNLAIEGDFVIPPGFSSVRPDVRNGVEDWEHPGSQAFHFRQSGPGVPNIQGIRKFLSDGQVITGEGGTYVGQDYPGSFTGVTASQSEPRYDYSFGPVESSVLQSADTEKELRVDGETITSILGRPIKYIMYPPQLVPTLTEMDKEWSKQMRNLGIPVKTEVLSFNALLDTVYAQEDFDLWHMGWTNTSPFGISSLYNIFHSDNADDHSEGNSETQLNNATGYGLFDYAGADDLISNARQTMETEARNDKTARATEKIYLDQNYMVMSYGRSRWPVDKTKWAGFLRGIPDPGSSYFSTQIMYGIHQKE